MSVNVILGYFCKSDFYHNRFLTTEQRFWQKVALTADDTRCWEWQGYCGPKGYGTFWLRGRMIPAHRVSLELALHIEPKLHVLHRCDNPKCVNPKHLYEGTNQQNMADRVSRNRQRKGENAYFAKLTSKDVKKIRLLLQQGQFTQTQIGELFGVNNSSISRINRGETWRHV